MLNKDFYHLSSGTIEVKSNTPNNVAFKVTGKSSHERATSGNVSHELASLASSCCGAVAIAPRCLCDYTATDGATEKLTTLVSYS